MIKFKHFRRIRKESVSSIESGNEIEKSVPDSCGVLADYLPNQHWSEDCDLHIAVLQDDLDICKGLLQSQPSITCDRNKKKETALHLAARSKQEFAIPILKELLNSGADSNAENKWGQTPLHYAAEERSLPIMKELLNCPFVDVNKKDVNGYTALHCLVDSSTTFDKVLKKGVQMLIEAGADINCQTNYGHSLLHLSSYKDGDDQPNSAFISYLVEKFPDLDLELKTQMGETFLHIYCQREVGSEVCKVLREIDPTKVSRLLNGFNEFGQTPWTLMCHLGEVHKQELENMIAQYDIAPELTDKLGNTGLHQLANLYVSPLTTKVFYQLKSKVDINQCNVFGQSPNFLIKDMKTAEMFINSRADFSISDRWGRTPLMSIVASNPDPDLIELLAANGQVKINAADRNGSTALHVAVFCGYEYAVERLLQLGASLDTTDNLGDRPTDTARRHFKQQILAQILQTDRYPMQQTVENKPDSNFLAKPNVLKVTSINNSKKNVQGMLGVPQDVEKFTEHLLASRRISRSGTKHKEALNISEAVTAQIQFICDTVAKYDERFKMTIYQTGSSVEGTKVGRPDEFDFVLCLDMLSEKFDIETNKIMLEEGFVSLKLKEKYLGDLAMLPFVDGSDYFMAHPFLNYLLRYFNRCLCERKMWEEGNLHFSVQKKCLQVRGKPVFNFSMHWIGSRYKKMTISVDLVPAVYMPGWWPENIQLSTLPLANEKVRSAGCFVLLQTRFTDLDFTRMQDSIRLTVKDYKLSDDHLGKRMLRISVAPAEICLMQSLPDNLRKGYALAKIMKDSDVCPSIELDRLPANRPQNRLNRPVFKPDSVIKSYLLKNCTFYVAEEVLSKSQSRSLGRNLTPRQIAIKIYKHLLYSISEKDGGPLKTYFPSYSDMLHATLEEECKGLDEFVQVYLREMFIRLILGILGAPSFEKFYCPVPSELPLQYVPFSLQDMERQQQLREEELGHCLKDFRGKDFRGNKDKSCIII